MKFQYDTKVVKKEVTANFFVVNSETNFASSSFATEEAATDDAVVRNDKALALGIATRYDVRPAADGECTNKGLKS